MLSSTGRSGQEPHLGLSVEFNSWWIELSDRNVKLSVAIQTPSLGSVSIVAVIVEPSSYNQTSRLLWTTSTPSLAGHRCMQSIAPLRSRHPLNPARMRFSLFPPPAGVGIDFLSLNAELAVCKYNILYKLFARNELLFLFLSLLEYLHSLPLLLSPQAL